MRDILIALYLIKYIYKNHDTIFYSDSAKEALSKTNIAELLVKQLRRAEKHERLELIIEVLQALVQNGKALFIWHNGIPIKVILCFHWNFNTEYRDANPSAPKYG